MSAPQEQFHLNEHARLTRERYMRELINSAPNEIRFVCEPVDPRIMRCSACGKWIKEGRFLGTWHLCE